MKMNTKVDKQHEKNRDDQQRILCDDLPLGAERIEENFVK
jgi:hypothetical protein